MKKKFVFIIVLTVALLSSNLFGLTLAAEESSVGIGDYVYLGEYNGEPILWRCVMIRDDGPLMVSDKVIDFLAFDATTEVVGTIPIDPNDAESVRNCYGSNQYKTSTLRKWLNSSNEILWENHVPNASHVTANPYEFKVGFMSSFTDDELAYIKLVNNVNVVSSVDVADFGDKEHVYSLDWRIESMLENYHTAFSQYTEDYFFLLNTVEIIEMSKNIGGYYEVAFPTSYAASKASSQYIDKNGATYYWLRDAYADYKFPEGVRTMYPGAHEYYYNANNGYIGVRPAFVLNFESFPYGDGSKELPFSLSSSETNLKENEEDHLQITDKKNVQKEVFGSLGVSQMQGTNNNISVGDYVYMGVMDGEPILWRCIDIDQNGPLMLSDKLLRFFSFDAAGEHTNDDGGEDHSLDQIYGVLQLCAIG